MTENEELVNTMTQHDLEVVSEGLTMLLGSKVIDTKENILKHLNYLTNKYGGFGLVNV